MIKTKNARIREAIGTLKTMSLRKDLRYLYEQHLKQVRDRKAEDEYVRDLGREEGRAEGKALKLISQVRKKLQKNNSIEKIAEMLEEEVASIAPIYDLMRNHPDWDDERISSELSESKKKVGGTKQ